MSAAVLSMPTIIPDSATVIAAAQQAAASHLHLVIDRDGRTKLTQVILPGMQKICVNVKHLEAAAESPSGVGHGRHLGAMYIARRKCGKVSAMCWDDPGSEKDTAKLVASYIKRGDSVERVERYENDPQPEWICRNGCADCVPPNNEQERSS